MLQACRGPDDLGLAPVRLRRPRSRSALDERKITKGEVEAVIADPLTIEIDAEDSCGVVLTRTVGGRRIAVVLAPEGVHWLVVTAWDVS